MATAKKIIEEHKEQHRIIAEALLEYETLDERQILSLYKTGKMPAQAEDEFPSEKAATFEEAKEALIRKDAVKQEESHRDELEDEFLQKKTLSKLILKIRTNLRMKRMNQRMTMIRTNSLLSL